MPHSDKYSQLGLTGSDGAGIREQMSLASNTETGQVKPLSKPNYAKMLAPVAARAVRETVNEMRERKYFTKPLRKENSSIRRDLKLAKRKGLAVDEGAISGRIDRLGVPQKVHSSALKTGAGINLYAMKTVYRVASEPEENRQEVKTGLPGTQQAIKSFNNFRKNEVSKRTGKVSKKASKTIKKRMRQLRRTSSRQKILAQRAAKKTAKQAARAARAATSSVKNLSLVVKALPVAMGLLVAIVILSLLATIFSTAASAQENYAAMEDSEVVIAVNLQGKGLDELHTAAVLGNIFAESRYSPKAINPESGALGIAQWLGDRKERYLRYVEVIGSSWDDINAQCDFLWAEMTGQGPAANYALIQIDYQRFLSITDIDEATLYFARNFERPSAAELESSKRSRLTAAKEAYMTLAGLGAGKDLYGQEFADATQKQRRVVTQAEIEPSTGAGWCAAWVSNVYNHAGVPGPGGNANDMYRIHCKSEDPSELKVGMLVATPSVMGTAAGQTYGHVGIYIGNNLVRSCQVGVVMNMTLQQFQAESNGYPLMWGWPNGNDLSKG